LQGEQETRTVKIENFSFAGDEGFFPEAGKSQARGSFAKNVGMSKNTGMQKRPLSGRHQRGNSSNIVNNLNA